MTTNGTENILWKAHPTQLLAFPFYLAASVIAAVCIFASAYIGLYTPYAGVWYFPLFGLIVVGLVTLVKYFLVRTKEYVLTSDRLVVVEGVFSRNTEELELYRVLDWSVAKPFWLRIFNTGHIRLMTSDKSAPELLIEGIATPEKVRETLRAQVEAARAKHRVRSVEFADGDVT